MTIASEITRLQEAKADIKASIQGKWVTVPNSAKLDTYSTYIDQIESWTWMDLFLPASLTIQDAFINSSRTVYMSNSIFDTVSPDGNTYYHYFRYEDDASTAYETYRIWVITKTAWNNLWLVQNLTAIDERNVHFLERIVDRRMKKEWNDVILSLLYTEEYDSSWQTASWRSKTYYCANFVNTSCTNVTLWTINADSWWQYSQADIDSMYSAWQTSCWMTSSEVIASLWLTSLSITYWSSSSRYTLVATLNIN